MRSPAVAVFFAMVSSTLLGCSSSAGPNTRSALEQACSAYANIAVSWPATCYGAAPEPDESTVISRWVKSCVLSSSASGSKLGPDYWNSCAALAANNCDGYDCGAYPSGTRQTGEPCLNGTQCASLWCWGTDIMGTSQGIQCGICAPRLTEGSACDSLSDACELGMSCFQGVCRKQGQAGDSCENRRDCVYPAICLGNGVCGTVTAAPKGRGQPCTTYLDCNPSEGCDLTTKICTPYQFGQPGTACDAEIRFCEFGNCDLGTGTCSTVTVLSDGAPCDPNNSATTCQTYSLCFGGTCHIPDPASCD